MSITEFVQQTAATTQVCVETLVSDGRIISWTSPSAARRTDADGVGRVLVMPLESRRAEVREPNGEPRPVWFFLDAAQPLGAA